MGPLPVPNYHAPRKSVGKREFCFVCETLAHGTTLEVTLTDAERIFVISVVVREISNLEPRSLGENAQKHAGFLCRFFTRCVRFSGKPQLHKIVLAFLSDTRRSQPSPFWKAMGKYLTQHVVTVSPKFGFDVLRDDFLKVVVLNTAGLGKYINYAFVSEIMVWDFFLCSI